MDFQHTQEIQDPAASLANGLLAAGIAVAAFACALSLIGIHQVGSLMAGISGRSIAQTLQAPVSRPTLWLILAALGALLAFAAILVLGATLRNHRCVRLIPLNAIV